MKRLKIIVGMIATFSLLFSGCTNSSTQNNDNISNNKVEEEVEENNTQETPKTTATQLADSLGPGWNLGNTLDSYNKNAVTEGYQLMVTYSSDPYTAWDQSEIVSFENGEATLNWELKTLNSTADSNVGSFSLQIINQSFQGETNSNPLTYEVEEAVYSTASGTKISLDGMIGVHTSSIKDVVTDYVTENFSGHDELEKTSDLLGGSLAIKVKITEYPLEAAAKDIDYETAWGNPKTTSDMIKTVKDAGFNSIRLPVTYVNHMDGNHVIDEEWLQRVEEVVQYILNEDMYCIINIHHEVGTDGWIQADADNLEKNQQNLAYIWQQIATYFKDYGDHLIFEGFNEIADATGDFNSTNPASYEAVNALNQTFVDVVRSCGAENENRFLIVNTYAAYTTEEVINAMKLPTDAIENHILVEVHCYSDVDALDSVFERLQNSFIAKGIPVIIGEFGMTNNQSSDVRMNYVETFVSKAVQNNLVYFWWDDGGIYKNASSVNNFALLNRSNCTWYFPEIVNVLTSPYQ